MTRRNALIFRNVFLSVLEIAIAFQHPTVAVKDNVLTVWYARVIR